MNWYIGQDVVCIKTHPDGIVKEGQIYTIQGLKIDPCTKCGGIVLDFGFLSEDKAGQIYQCWFGHGIPFISDGKYWLGEERFRPLDELADISELTEVLSEPVFYVKL